MRIKFVQYVCMYLLARRSILEEIVPMFLSKCIARGDRLKAIFKTEGTVFANADQPRLANNVYFLLW